jgi:hypothetical protein
MKRPIFLLLTGLAAWALIDGLQAYWTELDPDEAYYWMYSRYLDWGYFDHPPMVALMIRLGYSLFPNELGVRLLTVVLHVGTVWLVWLLAGKPAKREELLSLFVLLGAMPMFQLYGFITTPDPPLLFFTALFFWMYHLFLEKKSWGFTFLLGLSMVLMLYSKYHGLLVILFTLASNLRLLRNPRFYLASLFGAALFIPHLLWQFDNEFPSLKYHLVGRNDPYALKHTLNYLINQLVNFSPLLVTLWVGALWKKPGTFPMQRAYWFTVIGFLSFFLLATIKGHAEPQWTVVLSIPLALLGLHYLKEHPGRRRLYHILGMISIVLVLLARITIVTPWGAGALPEFHKKKWIQALKEKAGDRPVLFVDNYRDPSTYSFYTGDFSTAINDPISYRRNQFDIWSFEARYHGRDVLLFGLPEWVYCREMEPFTIFGKNRKTCEVQGIQIVQKVWMAPKEQDVLLSSGERQSMEVSVENPYPHRVQLDDPQWPVRPVLYLIRGENRWEVAADMDLNAFPGRETISANVSFLLPQLKAGTYQMAFMLEGNEMIYSVNSDLFEVVIE